MNRLLEKKLRELTSWIDHYFFSAAKHKGNNNQTLAYIEHQP